MADTAPSIIPPLYFTVGTYGQLDTGTVPPSIRAAIPSTWLADLMNLLRIIRSLILQRKSLLIRARPSGLRTAFYCRPLNNVTIKAAAGAEVTVAGLFASSGHIYQNATDYVLDKAVQGGMHTYYLAQKMSNITIEGITFTAKTDINTSIPETTINGFIQELHIQYRKHRR